MPKTVVVIPTYNEAKNLPALAAALFELGVNGLEILIVDDASPDGTGQMAEALAQQYAGRFHVLHRQGQRGLGNAYVQGFAWALAHDADYVIQMDADFSHSPDYIPQFLELIKAYDVVIGSRYVSGGSTDKHWSWWRQFLSWWANSVWVRLILGTKTHDATAGFKCWRRSALELIDLPRVRSNGYVFQVEMCYVSEKAGLRLKEIPIYFEDRRIGQSKMTVRVQLEAALRVLEVRWRYRGVRPAVRPVEAQSKR
jgi:dolichol-phosphate mannosyltransferase